MSIVKYDLEHIRIQYVPGRETGEGLAKEYSIPPETVRNGAHRE
jgi:hypothetical protein